MEKDIEQIFREIRHNFKSKMIEKIRTYEELKDRCQSMCYENCVANYKPPAGFNRGTIFGDKFESGRLSRQKKAERHCKERFQNMSENDCIGYVLSEESTKDICRKTNSLEKEIAGLFDLYEKEIKDMKMEEADFLNGKSVQVWIKEKEEKEQNLSGGRKSFKKKQNNLRKRQFSKRK